MEHLRNILRLVLSLYQDILHTLSFSVVHNLLYVLFQKSNVEKLIFVVVNFWFFKWFLLHRLF